jgi:hypothetical protein
MAKSADVTYIAEQTPEKRALLEKLRALVTKTLPGAMVALKWGVPVYQVGGKNVCALAAFNDEVALNLFAKPSALADPKKRLSGGGATSRMLKVRAAKDIDATSIQKWLKAAATK